MDGRTFASVPRDLAPKFLSNPEFALAVGFARLSGGSDGSHITVRREVFGAPLATAGASPLASSGSLRDVSHWMRRQRRAHGDPNGERNRRGACEI